MSRSFARIALYLISLLAAATAALVYPDTTSAEERVHLCRADLEAQRLGKNEGAVANAEAMVPDAPVAAVACFE